MKRSKWNLNQEKAFAQEPNVYLPLLTKRISHFPSQIEKRGRNRNEEFNPKSKEKEARN